MWGDLWLLLAAKRGNWPSRTALWSTVLSLANASTAEPTIHIPYQNVISFGKNQMDLIVFIRSEDEVEEEED